MNIITSLKYRSYCCRICSAALGLVVLASATVVDAQPVVWTDATPPSMHVRYDAHDNQICVFGIDSLHVACYRYSPVDGTLISVTDLPYIIGQYGQPAQASVYDIAVDSNGNVDMIGSTNTPPGPWYLGPLFVAQFTPTGGSSIYWPNFTTGGRADYTYTPHLIAVTSNNNIFYEAEAQNVSGTTKYGYYYIGELTSALADTGYQYVIPSYLTETTQAWGQQPFCAGLLTVGTTGYICGGGITSNGPCYEVAKLPFPTGTVSRLYLGSSAETDPRAMAVDTNNLYITGTAWPTNAYQYAAMITDAVNLSGFSEAWSTVDNPNGQGYFDGTAIGLDGLGNVYVGGHHWADPGPRIATEFQKLACSSGQVEEDKTPFGICEGVSAIAADSNGLGTIINSDSNGDLSLDFGTVDLGYSSTISYGSYPGWDQYLPPGAFFKCPGTSTTDWYAISGAGLMRIHRN